MLRDTFKRFTSLTLQVRFLPLQIADGSLELSVFPVARVNVRLTVSPEEKQFRKQANEAAGTSCDSTRKTEVQH